MRSIQSVIFIRLLAIVIILIGLVSGVAVRLTTEAIKQFVISDATTSLSFVISNIETNYKSDLRALDQIATLEGFLPFEETTARTTIQQFLKLPNIFSTVHMYKKDGELVFAERRPTLGERPYKPKDNFNNKDASFVALAKSVISEKQSKASETFFTWSGELYQTYVTPVFEDKDKQHVFGILSGGVFPHLQKIDYLVKGLKLGEDNFIIITDSRGHYISSDGINEQEALSSLKKHIEEADRLFFAAGANGPGHALIDEKITIGPRSFIAMSLPMLELKLVVTLGINTHRIDQKTHELSYRLMVAMILGLLFSVVASIILGERLAKPFRQMAHTINEINKGNLDARAPYDNNDEIGYLAQRINTLAEKIQKSEFLGNLWSTEEELTEQSKSADSKDAGPDQLTADDTAAATGEVSTSASTISSTNASTTPSSDASTTPSSSASTKLSAEAGSETTEETEKRAGPS